ncbi:Non-hemolytic phospholipase C [BD1-7 clade bacterium]|uniref:Non-hemolytic phospholipase C n=1 Tax=BD1-7 clade bacterium TaxID=2029982 RepID=A0A5S9P968_9GAMM|nr:Non-hemolytic phospholipase C [BD1-7 clade bacterium]CAA0101235.1 Non-hemolytic phospholipase C [BD1-7 clade bacterium]
MESNKTPSKGSTVDIGLGYYDDIAGLFLFSDKGMKLTDTITFIFSQTLQRDMFFASWAVAYVNGDGEYRVRITSPSDDVSAYETLIPNYIAAGKMAMASYYENIPYEAREGWEFLMPFGLAMANVKSVQLLHFPPLETFTTKNYLYSPTNRRWECLLAQNGFDGSDNTTVERVIDIAPIAAPGGAGNALVEYNEDFVPYAMAQLRNYLHPLSATKGTVTQPVVAYGGPVHDWLKLAFDLKDTPRTLDIIKLTIAEGVDGQPAPTTWVLCANHPSEYLYDTSVPLKDATKPNGDYPAPIEVMCQDLIAAGWQAHMSAFPQDDPYDTLKDMEERWGWDSKTGKVSADKEALVLAIVEEQNTEFSFGTSTFTPTDAQTNADTFALQRSTESDAYASFAIEPEADDIFSSITMAESATLDTHHRLMQAGGYLIDWTPATNDDDEIHYRVLAYSRDSANPLAEKVVTYGRWPKDKFFGEYRPNYGSTFNDIELIGFPGYVLSIIPAAGRRTYQLWNFDPYAEDDCLSSGEFKQGGFRSIDADRELYPIGNYVLDRKGADYRLWSFDPQSNPPLALPTVQSGDWPTINNDDAMVVLGNHVLTWKPDQPCAGCRLWHFDPSQSNPLGDTPIKTSALPDGFDKHSTLLGVVPSQPKDETREKTPGTIEFMRNNIEHVVYYMLESRSFDNVLGWLYKRGKKDGLNWVGDSEGGFRGLDLSMKNPMPDGTPAHVSQYQSGKLSDQFVLGGPAQDPWHDNSDGLMQMFHGYEGYAERSTPTMDGFAWNQDSPAIMSSFTPEQLTVMNGLAKHFGVSDDWFGSIPGGTDVNRGFSVSGSAYNRLGTWEGGTAYEDWPNSAHRQSIWKALWNHGHTDWKIYYNILWEKAVFTYQLYLKGQIPEVDAAWAKAVVEAKGSHDLPDSKWISPMQQFYKDIENDSLPSFSYIEPAWVGDECTSYHPGSNADGIDSLVPAERALNDIYEALSKDKKIWDKTLLVVTFDKNGGLFDHVPPPYANKPWPNDVADGFEFDLMGPRVPAVFASPWIKPSTVLRDSDGKGFDSTSFAATLLNWYNIAPSTWGLGDRMDQAPTFEGIFNETRARTSAPKLKVPFDKDFPDNS